jgi:hypothetical protein
MDRYTPADVHVGNFRVSDEVKQSFPMRRVPLQPGANFRKAAYRGGAWDFLPEVLDSSNMLAYGDALYWTQDPENLAEGDFMITFEVASDNVVSVVASADQSGSIVPWHDNSSSVFKSGSTLTRVEGGRVTSGAMLDHELADFEDEAWQSRLSGRSLLPGFLGVFWLCFAADGSDICRLGREPSHHYGSACGRSCLISLMMKFTLCIAAALAVRSMAMLTLFFALLAFACAWDAGMCSGVQERWGGTMFSPRKATCRCRREGVQDRLQGGFVDPQEVGNPGISARKPVCCICCRTSKRHHVRAPCCESIGLPTKN